MSGIAEFLNARFDEEMSTHQGVVPFVDPENQGAKIRIDLSRTDGDTRTTKTVAPYDPHHALADLIGKRWIVRDCEQALADGWDRSNMARRILSHLAFPYEDHPDYKAEWRA